MRNDLKTYMYVLILVVSVAVAGCIHDSPTEVGESADGAVMQSQDATPSFDGLLNIEHEGSGEESSGSDL